MYMVQGFILGNYALGIKTLVTMIYNQMITRDRYVRDTYKELDISELPPGEVLQTSWNGDLIFVRRLTKSEVDQTNALPTSTQLDKESKTTHLPLKPLQWTRSDLWVELTQTFPYGACKIIRILNGLDDSGNAKTVSSP